MPKVVHNHHVSAYAYAQWVQAQLSRPEVQIELSRHGSYCTNVRRRDKGFNKLMHGDNDVAERAQEMLDKIMDLIDIDIPRTHTRNFVYGSRPNVARAIAGHPFSMRQRIKYDRLEPVKVYISIASTWDVKDAEILQRAVTLSAFAMLLAERREVELILVRASNTGGRHETYAYHTYPINTNPMVLSELTSLDSECSRYVGLVSNCCQVQDYTPGMPYVAANEEKAVRESLGLAADDMYIGPINSWDDNVRKPIEWLKRNIAKYLPDEGE